MESSFWEKITGYIVSVVNSRCMINYESHTLRPQKKSKTTRLKLSAFLDRFYQGAWITWYLKVSVKKCKPPPAAAPPLKESSHLWNGKKSSFIHEAFCFFLAYAISRSISYSAGLGSPKSSFPWNALGQEWKLMTTKRISSPCHHMSKHQSCRRIRGGDSFQVRKRLLHEGRCLL